MTPGAATDAPDFPNFCYADAMDEHEQPTSEKNVESEGDRRLANIVLVVILVILVGGGVWLANAMFEQRTLDDCLAQGRRNCAPIEAPAR
jgi:hypothetical protein